MRNLTDQQKKFLEALFSDTCRGDIEKAAGVAGYSYGTSAKAIAESLSEEIQDLTRKYLTASAAKAAFRVFDVVDDPTILGAKELLSASKDILDRAGLKGKDTVEVKSDNPIFVLPPKQEAG